MNNIPREMLRKILIRHGRDIGSDARRCEGLLNDLCGAYRREINVLVEAIDERIPLDLLAGARTVQPELLLTRLEKRLEDQTALTTEASRWAVESWALALDVVTDTTLKEIRRKQSNSSVPPVEGLNQAKDENKSAKQSDSNFDPPNTNTPPKAPNPIPTSKTAPTVNKRPTKIPPFSYPANLPANNQPPPLPAQPVNPPLQQQSAPSVVSRGGSFFLRGCLIVIFLLIAGSVVLFLGVPYAIEVMRETQRERNNEPPRFPTR